ncbi:MAG TPA: histidine phosphatase family protein [Kofleriaceae bacterium]|nr:histidine phosphatase family protein [Kofleriaceae bacterium]
MTGRVFAVRHGETAWSLSGQHTGSTDIPLTERGRELATLLKPVLHRTTFELVLTSPLGRARETCELCGFADVAMIEPALVEWNYGEYEGLTSKQIHETRPGWMVFNDGAPGGESPWDVAARVDRVIERVRTVDGNALIFAHGHLLRVFAARWLGLPPAAGQYFLLDTGTLNILSAYHGVPAIETWNAPFLLRDRD